MAQGPLPGTRSITRAIDVAKAVAEHKQIGWRLTDLAARCGLEKSTTFRILSSLVAERLVQKRATDRRYIPGPLMFELALCTPGYANFVAVVHPVLARIAATGASAHLYLRSGYEVVCIDDVSSKSSQQLTTRGRRLPIEQSTYGIAMILAMSKSEQQELLKFAEARRAPGSKNATAYRKVLADSRMRGFALNSGMAVPNLISVAVAVLDRQQQPFAAIGVVAPSTLLQGKTIERMVDVLRQESGQITEDAADLIAELR